MATLQKRSEEPRNAEKDRQDPNRIYRQACETAGYGEIVHVRAKFWAENPELEQQAVDWLGSNGGCYDTEHGFDPPIGTVAMMWRDWSDFPMMHYFAFADHRKAFEFKLAFG